MDADWTRLGFNITQTVITAAIGIYVWLSNRHRAMKQDIDHVDERVDALKDRLVRVESAVEHMPDHQSLGRVHNRIDQVGQGLKGVEAEIKSMNHTVQLIQQHLMGKGQ